MSNELRIPQILMEQRGFCLKIAENNAKLFEYIEYLKTLVTSMHAIYQQLCRRMAKACEECERRITAGRLTSQHSMVMLGLVRSLSLLHVSMGNQLNNNGVALGTKSHKVARNRLQILREKLEGCDKLNKDYLQMVEAFNKKERSLREKCEYFRDYEKDVLKYYSLKANCDLYDRLSAKELRLRQRLQAIIRSKDEYKINISEIRLTIKEYYEMELAMLADYKRLLLNIRKSAAQRQLYNQPIIEELSEEAASTVLQDPPSKRSERARSVVHMRREIIKDYQRTVEIEELLEELLRVLRQEVEGAGKRIDEIRSDKQYHHFAGERLVMSEILPAESLRDVDLILGEISFFRSIVLRLGNVFGKTKVLEELKKYRGFNFDRFVEDTNPLAEHERKQGESSELRSQFMVLEMRFQDAHSEYNARYQERVVQLEQLILSHYYLEEQVLEERGRRNAPKADLFEKKYYEILMIPFFLNKHENFAFVENPHLKKFSDHINANRIQKMMTLTGFFRSKEIRLKPTCCGLIRVEQPEEGPKLVDEFHCALKDGLILVQGKLKLFENYLNFSSNFNSKTIFGYSDIRIPKWDINAFSEDRHLLSAMVVVETNHGALYFTSFLTNPFQLLQTTYSDRRSGMSVAEHRRPAGDSELELLEGRFQGELRGELKRRNIVIDKLSTYLSEGRQSLSLCIEYHLNGTTETELFEIKINYSEVSLEYMFIHDEAQKSQEVRGWLEAAAKELINRKPNQPTNHTDPPAQNTSIIDLEYSIIEPNERNKISFLREPSFINRRSDHDSFLRNSQADCGQLLTSRNFLNQETSKNIEMLEQRILFSEEDDKNTRSNLAFHQQDQEDPHEHSSTPLEKTNAIQRTFTHVTGLNDKDLLKERSRMVASISPHSRTGSKSTQASRCSAQAFNYRTILLLMGILLGLNLILNALY